MAKEGFLGSLGRFASQLVDVAPEGPRNVLYAIGPWLNDLTRNASQHWLPHLILGVPCEVIYRDPQTQIGMQCAGPAIAACSVCRKPTCLEHSFVSRMAQAVCFGCVKQGIDDRTPKIPWPAGTRGNPSDPRAAPHGAQSPPGHEPRTETPPAAPPPNPLDVQFARARKILRVKRSATWPEVEASYKELLVKHHPDRNPDDRAGAETRFKQVRVAYDLLKKAYETP